MQVTREVENFRPITITLETEEEAEFFYYFLLTATSKIKELVDCVDYTLPEGLDTQMFDVFRGVYDPYGDC